MTTTNETATAVYNAFFRNIYGQHAIKDGLAAAVKAFEDDRAKAK